MKIAINISTSSNNLAEASLIVLDGEDFPSEYIFDSFLDWPSIAGFRLKPKLTSVISTEEATPEEAKKWALEQVEYLKKMLAAYRATTHDAPIFFVI